MIGIFDSGEGGYNTLEYVRRRYPMENIILLVDRKNSPYGLKSEGELEKIVSENLRILNLLGADAVLIGCCTASGVWDRMSRTAYDGRVVSIIRPTRERAEKMTEGKIAVIATEATIASHSFGRDYISLATQELVDIIDSGVSDGNITAEDITTLEELLSPLRHSGAELLILGCTHFGRLKGRISDIVRCFGVKRVIDSAEVGAKALLKIHPPKKEQGITYCLKTTKA